MTSIRLRPSFIRTKRLVAISLSLCLALASIGPGAVIACEGAGEEEEVTQNISIRPIAWSGGGNCPRSLLRKIQFSALGQWCEYLVQNLSATEKVIVVDEQGYGKACNFGAPPLCLGFKLPANPQCNPTILVNPRNSCYVRLEYINKPLVEAQMSFIAKAEFLPSSVMKERELLELVKP